MQTFAPLTDFADCARVLDRQRLGKQRVECGQILASLASIRVHESGLALPRGWTRHPAVLMWRGYESALGVYMTFMCAEWMARGYENNMVTPYSRETFKRSEGWPDLGGVFVPDGRDAELPPWWGDDRVHKSHRNALVYKDRQHYGQFDWGGLPILDYFWPVTGEAEYTPEGVHPGSQYASVYERRKKSAESQ